jgi:phage recombination protein Bet
MVHVDQVKRKESTMDTQTGFTFTEGQAGLYGLDFDDEKIDLMRRTLARGATEDELALFIEQCRRTGLDPFARQIYSVRRKQWNSTSRSYEEAQVIQVSIDGFRLVADRTHKYAGQVGPWWCGADGAWKEVWLNDEPPSAAKVGVLRHDFHQPLFAIALYKSYVQVNGHGEPISRWKSDPAGMLAKCAEALALRRAFPNEMSGLYTTEEMGQVDNPTTVVPENGNGHANPAVEVGIAATGASTNPVPVKTPNQRPFLPEELRANFARAVSAIEARGLLLGPDDYVITENALGNLLEDARDRERYLEYISGIPYLEDMSEAYVVALLRLLRPASVEGTFLPCEEAQTEAAEVISMLDADTVQVEKTLAETALDEQAENLAVTTDETDNIARPKRKKKS